MSCRFASNYTPGIQEYIESLAFHHYLATQALLSYDDLVQRILRDTGVEIAIDRMDYLLGIMDIG